MLSMPGSLARPGGHVLVQAEVKRARVDKFILVLKNFRCSKLLGSPLGLPRSLSEAILLLPDLNRRLSVN